MLNDALISAGPWLTGYTIGAVITAVAIILIVREVGGIEPDNENEVGLSFGLTFAVCISLVVMWPLFVVSALVGALYDTAKSRS